MTPEEAERRGKVVRDLKDIVIYAAKYALATLPWDNVAHIIEETGVHLEDHIPRGDYP